MGIAKSAVFELTTGSIANMIFYRVGDQTRFRTKTGRYKDQKSPQQVAQRTKMKGIANLYHKFDMQLITYWRELGKGTVRSGYNLFMSDNIKNLNGEGEIMDYNLFKISRGNLPLPQEITADFSTEKMVKINWLYSDESKEAYDDYLQIAVYTPTREKGAKIRMLEQTQVQRRAMSYECQIPEDLDTPVWFFVFFKSRYTNEISTSCYIGNIEQAGQK